MHARTPRAKLTHSETNKPKKSEEAYYYCAEMRPGSEGWRSDCLATFTNSQGSGIDELSRTLSLIWRISGLPV